VVLDMGVSLWRMLRPFYPRARPARHRRACASLREGAIKCLRHLGEPFWG
jgi:hypothetical protein